MKKWIEDLLELQTIDMRIRNMKMRLEMLPKEKVSLEAELKKEEGEIKSKSEHTKKTELAIKNAESSIAQVNDTIKKIQSNSAMVKKNVEYQAMMSEIAQNKAKISDFETEEITLLDELEKAKSELKEFEKQFQAKVKTIKENLAELRQMEGEVREEINRLIAERGLKENGISQDVIRLYSRLLKTSGDPLVKVNNDICGNCHLKLTPQTLAETRKGSVINCDNCQHLLYYAEEK